MSTEQATTNVDVMITEYVVTVVPEDHPLRYELLGRLDLAVAYIGGGRWEVRHHGRPACLSNDGADTWSVRLRPSSLTAEWLDRYTFGCSADALDAARRVAPRLRFRGRTAAEIVTDPAILNPPPGPAG